MSILILGSKVSLSQQDNDQNTRLYNSTWSLIAPNTRGWPGTLGRGERNLFLINGFVNKGKRAAVLNTLLAALINGWATCSASSQPGTTLSPNTDASPAAHNSDRNHEVVTLCFSNPALISCSFHEGSLLGPSQLCREMLLPDQSCLRQGFYGRESSLKFTKQEFGLHKQIWVFRRPWGRHLSHPGMCKLPALHLQHHQHQHSWLLFL